MTDECFFTHVAAQKFNSIQMNLTLFMSVACLFQRDSEVIQVLNSGSVVLITHLIIGHQTDISHCRENISMELIPDDFCAFHHDIATYKARVQYS